jgi:hypothetical protein
VKVIAYIKRESVGFHKAAQKSPAPDNPGTGLKVNADQLGRELHQIRQLVNLAGDALKRLIQQTARGVVHQRVVS